MSGAQKNDDLEAINSVCHALTEIEETLNATFAFAVATVVMTCFGLSVVSL